MTIDTSALGDEGMQRFERLRRNAVDAVTGRFYTDRAADYEPFGQRGREACREDLGYDLEFLRPVLELGLVQPMVDYLRWLASVLATRDIPAQQLSLSLDWLAEFFDANLEEGDAKIVVGALRQVNRRYIEADDAPSATCALMPQRWPECAAFEGALLAGDHVEADANAWSAPTGGDRRRTGDQPVQSPGEPAWGR